MDDFPSAAEVRAQTNQAMLTAAQDQITDIRTRIAKAVEQGQSSIGVDSFRPGVKEMLKAKGYKVRIQRDFEDVSEYEVSW